MDPPREAEVLVIAVDGGKYAAETPEKFDRLRDIATRMARNRLLYSETADDLIGVFKLGSEKTDNRLADDNAGGYKGIEKAFPAVRRCLQAVRTLRDMTPGLKKVNLLDVVEVLGDYLADFSLGNETKKRIVIFTRKGVVPDEPVEGYCKQLAEVCELYRDVKVRVDVVCDDWTEADDDKDEDQRADETAEQKFARTVENFFTYATEKEMHPLWAFAHATGGSLYSGADALDAVDMPIPKGKRATAKFRGTLNIGAHIKIPTKAYITTSIAIKQAAVKLSWAASRNAGEPVGVHVESQRFKSAADDTPLEENEIVHAFPYGNDLVPEQRDTGEDAWSLCLDGNDLSVIAFVSQKVVPVRWFMSAVCAVISMPDVAEARVAMDALVQALHESEKGILARWVPALKGGPPGMAYLWPVVEMDKDTGKVKNRYLCLADLPLQEDLRDYPFSSLKWTEKDLPAASDSVMDAFIDDRMLDGTTSAPKPEDKMADEEDDDDDDDDAAEPFRAYDHCNPALDRFYIAVIQRALDGPEGTEIPGLAEWQKHLLDTQSFIPASKKESAEESLKNLKSTLPVSKVPPKERAKKKTIEMALQGEDASICDFLPPDTQALDETTGPTPGAEAAW